jgi:hypothetical protein
MFAQRHLGLTLFRGWTPILGRACEQIDELMADGATSFHWVSIREEEGNAHLIYCLVEQPRYVLDIERDTRRAYVISPPCRSDSLAGRIDAIVKEAERLTSEACLVCGSRTSRSNYFGQLLPLCQNHDPEGLNRSGEEGLAGLWRECVEWEEP